MESDEELDEELDIVSAANGGDLKKVTALIAAGADVNRRNQNGVSALTYAASHREVAMTEALIQAGADVNARSNLNGTALRWAVKDAPVEAVRVLLDAGADVNDAGGRALRGAIYRQHPEIVGLLIERGVDLTVDDEHNGGTPLALAKKRGNGDVVRLLKAAGATA